MIVQVKIKPTTRVPANQPPALIMAIRYGPLILVSPLHNMPHEYQTRIHQSDGSGSLNSQKHVDKMNDLFDLQELYEAYVQMRLFAQILTSDVKKRFKELLVASIVDIIAFHQSFLSRWEVKKNPLQILFESESIKRNQGKSV
jgi:hypothetical protein